MTKAIREGSVERTARVGSALAHLRAALADLKAGDCPRTADRVRSALRSCEGALRHAGHRERRGEVEASPASVA